MLPEIKSMSLIQKKQSEIMCIVCKKTMQIRPYCAKNTFFDNCIGDSHVGTRHIGSSHLGFFDEK